MNRTCAVLSLPEPWVQPYLGSGPRCLPLATAGAVTYHLAGIAILIVGVSNDSIPTGLGAYDYDQAELGEAMLRERSLLYVAATRARDELVISYNGQRSTLLP